jgi:hypothetical protein
MRDFSVWWPDFNMLPRSGPSRALTALVSMEAEMTRNEIEAARRRIILLRICVRRLRTWLGFEARRREKVFAATLAREIEDSKAFAQAFEVLADQAGIPKARAGSSPYRRLLRFLELEVTGSSMSRACRQIEACVKAGWSKKEIERRMMAGPSKIA